MLLVRGAYLWTGTELLTDAGALCHDGRIESVGPFTRLQQENPGAEVVGGPDTLVLPGLINAHHHGNGITSFMRGVADDALEPWLAALGTAPPVDPYLDTLWAAIGLLEGGYSTVVLFQSTSHPEKAREEALARIRACRDAGLRIAFGLDLMQQNFLVYGPVPEGIPRGEGMSTDSYIALLEELRAEFASDPAVTVFAAPAGPQWVTDEGWQAIGAWTQKHKVPLHTHCLESPYEAEFARRSYDGSAVRYLDHMGALHQHTSLVHGVYLTQSELDLMHSRGASLITNPGSNLRLRCGVSPVLAALQHGVTVALGTDSCSVGERDDAFGEMRLLYYLQRGRGITTPALTWHQAVHTSTLAAASVTPWGDALGSIQPGGMADFSLFDLTRAAAPWTHGDIHPVQLMVQRGSREHLVATVVAGQVVYEAGIGPILVDVAEVERTIRERMNGTSESYDTRLTGAVREYFRDWPIP